MRAKWRVKKTVAGRTWDRVEKAAEPGSDPEYLAWLHTQPCAVRRFPFPGVTPCGGPIEAHHPTGAGMALKAPDSEAFSLCRQHHVPEFHGSKGAFWRWTQARRREWQRAMTAKYQELYRRTRCER